MSVAGFAEKNDVQSACYSRCDSVDHRAFLNFASANWTIYESFVLSTFLTAQKVHAWLEDKANHLLLAHATHMLVLVLLALGALLTTDVMQR